MIVFNQDAIAQVKAVVFAAAYAHGVHRSAGN